jgi:His-Xaa-Ser system protein HxsD
MMKNAKGILKLKDGEEKRVFRLSKEFFEKEAILAAIHAYGDKFSTNMFPLDDGYVGVSFKPKDEHINIDSELADFTNKIIDQQIRRDLNRESGHIRDTIVEYAYSAVKKKLELTQDVPKPYGLMPFQFSRFAEQETLLVNMAGEHLFIANTDFERLLNKSLEPDSEVFKTLYSKFFVYQDPKYLESAIELIANQIRTKQRYLLDFTSLHMVEVTSYCNLNCDYCHASSVTLEEKELKKANNLREKIIDGIVEKIFQSPSNNIKIELQGGEPLVNWKSSKYLIERSYEMAKRYPEKIQK